MTVVSQIANAGTVTSEPANGGARTLQGALTNTGKLAINTNTTFNGTKALLGNEGALTVLEGKTLTVSNDSSFTNGTGGSIAASGSPS